jgi:peroxiredoxin (alkyl hydroperoxide reductase subunit C)
MMTIGQPISDHTLDAFHDGKLTTYALESFRGKWLAIVFYPGDFTFVCPTELEELADRYESFTKLNAEVLSVSTDSEYVHAAWHETSPKIRKIRFPMLADKNAVLAREFGVYREAEGDALRGTFIIDPEGILRAIEINDTSIGRNADELLRRLQAAIYVREHNGEVCPASWKPGEKTLKPGIDLVGKL